MYGIGSNQPDDGSFEDESAQSSKEEETKEETKEGEEAKCSILCSFLLDEQNDFGDAFEGDEDGEDPLMNLFITFDDVDALEAARLVFDERYISNLENEVGINFGDEDNDEDEDEDGFGEINEDFVLED